MADIVEVIVRAALDPDGWVRVSAEMEKLFRSQSSGLHIQNVRDKSNVYFNVTGHAEKDIQFYQENIAHQNPWFEHEGLMQQGRVLTDETIDRLRSSSKAFENTVFYAEFQRALDYRHHMGGTILENDVLAVNYTNARAASIGPYSEDEMRRFKALMPLLATAAEMAAKLEATNLQLHAAGTLVDRLNCGVILIDAAARILYANGIADGHLRAGIGLRQAQGKLATSANALTQKIEHFAKAWCRVPSHVDDAARFAPFSGAVKGADDKPLTVTVLPIPRDMAIFSWNAPVAVIVVASRTEGQSIAPSHWRDQYGFTSIETTVGEKVVEGLSTREIADALELTYETTRWYIKQIRAKTSSLHHAELQKTLSLDIINFLRR